LAAVFTSIATVLHRIELAERALREQQAAGERRAAGERERLLEQIKAANVELEERVRERTQELLTRLREREVLLQEVQHRVNNNLQLMTSLIGLQLDGVVEAESRAALQVCQNRMAAIVVVHRSSYASGDYSRVDFLACVRAIAAHVLGGVAAAGTRIRLECEGQLSLPVSQAIPCGLIVNELVSNAILHAFPGARSGCVQVTLKTEPDGGAALVVADDGAGMAPARAEPPAQSVGLMLVKSLTEQLEGRLEVETGAGTCVRVTFPLA
jgi:two-component sensor histidine kinase